VIYITNFITPLEATELVALRYFQVLSFILCSIFTVLIDVDIFIAMTISVPHHFTLMTAPVYSPFNPISLSHPLRLQFPKRRTVLTPKVSHDTTYRSSLTATLPYTPIVQKITSRAQSFPFYSSSANSNEKEKKIKPLVVQKYGLGKQYKDHYDVFSFLFISLPSYSLRCHCLTG